MAGSPARRSRPRSCSPVTGEEKVPARQSPTRARSRSRSPRRSKKNRTGGFRWKEKRAGDDEDRDSRDSGGLQRGYRDTSPRRDRTRGRDRDGHSTRARTRSRSRSPRRDRPGGNGNRSPRRDSYPNRNGERDRGGPPPLGAKKRDAEAGARKDKPAAVPSLAGQEMIIVHVNDRLGTKTAIPCLADDTIRSLKLMVAMRIGREPHEILLKRQSERPFKDQLTLRDYGISHGVQIDLEVDTGD